MTTNLKVHEHIYTSSMDTKNNININIKMWFKVLNFLKIQVTEAEE